MKKMLTRISGVRGDLSGLRGDIDNEERINGVDVKDLIN